MTTMIKVNLRVTFFSDVTSVTKKYKEGINNKRIVTNYLLIV
jgi:hypothetical protein